MFSIFADNLVGPRAGLGVLKPTYQSEELPRWDCNGLYDCGAFSLCFLQ